jgi:hypothetical protein
VFSVIARIRPNYTILHNYVQEERKVAWGPGRAG